MNTLVNFKIAQLLEEKGFDLKSFITIDDSNPKNLDSNFSPREYQPWYFDLTIAEVVMWLYEKHGIWISSSKNYDEPKFGYGILVPNSYNLLCSDIECKSYNSPTEAYEAAIEYTLNNLIK